VVVVYLAIDSVCWLPRF